MKLNTLPCTSVSIQIQYSIVPGMYIIGIHV